MAIKEKFDLTGRVALITGGARGIGRACAEGLADFGADIAIADILEETLNRTAAELGKQYGVRAKGFISDVTQAAAVNDMVQRVLDHFGKIDLGTDWRDSKSVSARLQELVVREKVCLAMFSQVSPATQTELERDNRTTTAKFFGTSSPYQDADVVMFMCKHNGLLKDGSGYDNDKSYVTCFQVVKVREYSNLQSYFMLRYVPDWYAYGKEVESE